MNNRDKRLETKQNKIKKRKKGKKRKAWNFRDPWKHNKDITLYQHQY